MSDHWTDPYNIVWTTPSRDASESMPCGGGDLALNVWVEAGDLLFYISRPGSLAEQNEYLKLGRMRVRVTPNPFDAPNANFRQTLVLRDGHVEITGRIGDERTGLGVTLRVWTEVHRPIVHVDVDSDHDVSVVATYENWRLAEEVVANDGRRHSCFDLMLYPGEVRLGADVVEHVEGGIRFHHRNPNSHWLRDLLVDQQELQNRREDVPDDLCNRTFGGFVTGDGFVAAGQTHGRYHTKDFKGWQIRSRMPAPHHQLRIVTHIRQSETLDAWQRELDTVVADSRNDHARAREQTVKWWRAFWDRSRIAIRPDKPDPSDRAWRIARNYNLFRYQLGCNAFGEYPTKFNGGSFTFDANLVGDKWKDFGPDWRQWGGGTHTAQNQRLVYWPLLKSGDADVILPQFELYRKALPGAQIRARESFGHDGAVYSEYLSVNGLALGMGYGWESGRRVRGPQIPFGDPRADARHDYGDPVEKGVMACKPIAYHWESQVEHAYMILEYRRFTGADILAYIPFIENAVVFFNEHFRKRHKIRSGQELDENGHLVIYPAKACESYRGATNPADLISGLAACLNEIVQLDPAMLRLRDINYYRDMLRSIPPYSYGETKGRRVILPAKSWTEYGNAELPMLYPLFPFNQFSLGKDDMQVFKDTYELGDFRKGNIVSWHQDGIFFARMGQTEQAADFNARKLDDSERRFPTFWGPGHDWVPDHNWGGSGMIGLQEMLVQTIGDEIRLLPAWPKDWDVDFKLHAPKRTVVEGKVRAGVLRDLVVTPESRRKDVVLPA